MKKPVLSVLALLILMNISVHCSDISHPWIVDNAETRTSQSSQTLQVGPRVSDLFVSFFSSYSQIDAAFTSDEATIDFVRKPIDPTVKTPQSDFKKYAADSNITLSKLKGGGDTSGMPTLGQHSNVWCWNGAAANALYWLSRKGYYELTIDPGILPGNPISLESIDPESVDPDNSSWYCPCGSGYMRLLSRFATCAGLNFGMPFTGGGRRYSDCLKTYIGQQNLWWDLTVVYQKNWTLVPQAISENLGGYSAVIIHLEPLDDLPPGYWLNDELCDMTGPMGHTIVVVGYDGSTMTLSDSATNLHNNDPSMITYETAIVTAEPSSGQPLQINYHGKTRWVNWVVSIEPRIYAYRREICGAISQRANIGWDGVVNKYTLLKCYRTPERSPPTVSIGHLFPYSLNVLYAYDTSWIMDLTHESLFWKGLYYESPTPDNIWLPSPNPWLRFLNPLPAAAQDWEIGSWIDPQDGFEKTMVTFYLRKNVGIAAPITGNFMRFMDAEDVEFTIWYNYAWGTTYWETVSEIKYTRVVDVNSDYWNELQVYFNNWNPLLARALGVGLRILARDELLPLLCLTQNEAWTQNGLSEHSLAHNLVDVVSATLDGTPLVEGVDYFIKADSGQHGIFLPLRDLSGSLILIYWDDGAGYIDPTGYYLGSNSGLSWEQTMYSTGPYCVNWIGTDFIYLRGNPHYFLETPPLGEIDWRYEWKDSPKPRTGFYKLSIYDIVAIAGAYGTTGCGFPSIPTEPSPRWNIAADISPSPWPPLDDLDGRGWINIYDVVTVASHYGETWNNP
jgi:hypothetical protein